MIGTRRGELVERKALLAAHAELDRARITLAAQQIRAVVAPSPDGDRTARYRPVAAMLVGVLGPSFGKMRVGRWLRFAGFALAALRVLRSWR